MADFNNTTADTFIAGTGEADSVYNSSAASNVTIETYDGNDTIQNYGANVTITGGANNDSIKNGDYGTGFYSYLIGGDGDDTIWNRARYVTIDAGAGNDSVYTDIHPSPFQDVTVYGGDGNDTLIVNDNRSSLNGGAGDDLISVQGSTRWNGNTLEGGTGNDTLYGGGNNVFFYQEGDGNDIIYNYTNSDKIQINSNTPYSSVQSGENVLITIGDGSILLMNSTLANVDIYYAESIVSSGVNVDLNDVGENQTGLFIVNKITAEDGTTSINPDAVFAPNALNYNNHIYAIYSNVNTTWNDAKTYCENLGGHLVTITDAAEQAAVQNLLQSEENPVNSYWIGGYTESEVATEGWQWTSGETIPAGEAVNAEGANYSNWAEGEPNNSNGDENSLMMFGTPYPDSAAAVGTWNDLNSAGTLNEDEFYGTENIGLICEWDNAIVVGEVTENNIYVATENTEYSQNITIPENWDVTATANNDILNITADGVTAEGGEGSDRFAVSSGVNDVVFADFTPADDSLSFADRIPEESLHESYSSGELMLSNDDINLTFQNMAGLTEELLNEEVNNGGVTNTVEQLIESVPYVTVNQDAPVMMSLSHWSYGFYPPTE